MHFILGAIVSLLGSQVLVSSLDTLRHRKRESRSAKYTPSLVGGVFFLVSILSSALFARGNSYLYNIYSLIVVASAGVCLSGIALHITVCDRFFSKSKSELFHSLLSDLQSASFNEVRNVKYVLRYALFCNSGHLVLGTSILSVVSYFTHLTIISLYASMLHPNIQCNEAFLMASFVISFLLHGLAVLLLVRAATLFAYEYIRVITTLVFAATQLVTHIMIELSVAIKTTSIPSATGTFSAAKVLHIVLAMCLLLSAVSLHYTTMFWRQRSRASTTQNDENSVVIQLTKRFAAAKPRSVQVRPSRLTTPVLSLQTSGDESNIERSLI